MVQRRVVFAIGLMIGLLAAFGCVGDGPRPSGDLTPELFDLQIIPNPADVGSEPTFIASFKDLDGDMLDATVELIVETEEDEEEFEVPVIDLQIDGEKTGSIAFRIEVLPEHQGAFKLRVTDEDGNRSDEVEEFLFVNEPPIPADEG